MVIADTSVWITFQRDPDSEVGRELDALLGGYEVAMVGPVLMEILQGSRTEEELAFFADHLTALAFLDSDQETWLKAGQLSFQLKNRGMFLPFADIIISALAVQHGVPLFTLDQGFRRVPELELYARHNGG